MYRQVVLKRYKDKINTVELTSGLKTFLKNGGNINELQIQISGLLLAYNLNNYRRRKNTSTVSDFFHEMDNQQSDLSNAKQIEMLKGNLAQVMIGNAPGFLNLGQGHATGLDCKKKDNSMYIELKHKFNTDNSSSRKSNMYKLSQQKRKNENARCIYGVINGYNGKAKSKMEDHGGQMIEILHGEELFKVVYGDDYRVLTEEMKRYIVQCHKMLENCMEEEFDLIT